jgi:predicted nucleotidyltransferase
MEGERDDIERHIMRAFQSVPGVAAVYLFGSVARGTARAGSDLDVGVLYLDRPAPTLEGQPYELEAALERAVGRPVEVVVLNAAPVDLRSRVLRDGRLIIDRDRSARIAFEVRTRNEAWDLEPVLREYRSPRRNRA